MIEKDDLTGLDITGEKFGKLTVLEYAGRKISGRRREKVWKCRCDCGKEVVVFQHNLMCGNTQSCGCMRGRKYTTRGDL